PEAPQEEVAPEAPQEEVAPEAPQEEAQPEYVVVEEINEKINVEDTQITNANISEKEAEDENSSINIALIVILLVLLSISSITTYVLLKWRSKYKNQLVTFPENLVNQFDDLSKEFQNIKSGIRGSFDIFTDNLKRQTSISEKVTLDITKKYGDILESFNSLQINLDKKDIEIERLKEGYDFQILKKPISKLIPVIDTCEAIINDSSVTDETKKEVGFIKEQLEDIFDVCNIEKYEIAPNLSTKSEIPGLPPSSQWIQIPTDDESKYLTVKKTINYGYLIKSERDSVLKYAKIEVYVEGDKNE
ncbi:MAG: hypothetical protein CMD89_05240, partial [Gammaproteobacteria bacterium]|nr:hypothetical protein [Gammaproteobacteria bacterium]